MLLSVKAEACRCYFSKDQFLPFLVVTRERYPACQFSVWLHFVWKNGLDVVKEGGACCALWTTLWSLVFIHAERTVLGTFHSCITLPIKASFLRRIVSFIDGML